MSDGLNVNTLHSLSVNDNNEEFLMSNKKTTVAYRTALAQAIGTTGTIAKVTQMAFGIAGETDEQGNPLPPKDTGTLNEIVLTKDVKAVTYPIPTTVCFEAEILKGEVTATINEVALIAEDGTTAAKMRMLTSKGTDAESGLIFRWYVEF